MELYASNFKVQARRTKIVGLIYHENPKISGNVQKNDGGFGKGECSGKAEEGRVEMSGLR
jgi:hypothetical protein